MVMKNLPIGFTAMYVRIRYASSPQGRVVVCRGTVLHIGDIWMDGLIG